METHCDPVVVKLGGSVITVKDKPYTIDRRSLDKAAGAIAEYYTSRETLTPRIVIVLGGGSFGHYEVEKLTKEKGVLGPLEAAMVQARMLDLSREVLRVFLELGGPVTLHPPHTYCDGSDCNYSIFLRDALYGLVPVTYGDMVYDDRGARVLSGDDLAAHIADALRARCLIYVTRKGGLVSAAGRILARYTGVERLQEEEQEGYDVTGGIKRKIEAALEFAKSHPRAVVRIIGLDDLLTVLEGGEAGTEVAP